MEELLEILILLKKKGAVGVKVSFEDEGALINEVMTIRNITSKVGLELALKIGGCESKRDMTDATHICVDSIVAPMIESGFALHKFISSAKKYITTNIETGINIETIKSYNSIEELKVHFEYIDFVTFGRVDFVGSYNKERSFVENIEMRDMIEHVFTIVKKYNKKCYLGGAMSISSFDIVTYLKDKSLLDKIETRYIIFDVNKIDMKEFEQLMYLANVFETKWMNYIKSRYMSYAKKDDERINMIKKRIDSNILSNALINTL